MIAYRRLVPVSLVDALMVRAKTTEPLVLELPMYEDAATPMSNGDKRRSMCSSHDLVFTHQMFPLIPPGITSTPLPVRIWEKGVGSDELRRLWCANLASHHYAPYEDRRSILEIYGEEEADFDGLGIFGRDSNPLEPVANLAASIDDTYMLLHYAMVVCLQYYMTKRGCFMRVRTDADAQHFSDALPPFMFMLFRKIDCRTAKATAAGGGKALPDRITKETAEACAMSMPFPSFLLLVFRWMQTRLEASPQQKLDWTLAEKFCGKKMHKDLVQALMCIRCREVVPEGLCESIAASRGSDCAPPTMRATKMFQHPNACQLMALDPTSIRPVTALERVPYLMTHNSLRPDQPLLYEPVVVAAAKEPRGEEEEEEEDIERERMLIWKLLQYSPLRRFSKITQNRVNAKWNPNPSARPVHRIFPVDPLVKWQEYDGYIVNARANYSFYSPREDRGTHTYLMVPALHTPAAAMAPANDTDMRHMSPEAFDWCRTHGCAATSIADAILDASEKGRVQIVPIGDPQRMQRRSPGDLLITRTDTYEVYTCGPGWSLFTAWVVGHEITRACTGADANAYMHMLAYQLLSGREEDGVATAALSFTLEDMQASWTEMVQLVQIETDNLREHDPAFATLLARSMDAWDRCSPVPFPVHLAHHSTLRDRIWAFHFPPSHIPVRTGPSDPPVPWVALFSSRSKITRTLQRLKQVITLFDADVAEELMRAVGSTSLSSLQMQQLRSIMSLFATPGTPLMHALSGVCAVSSSVSVEVARASDIAKAFIVACQSPSMRAAMEEARRLVHFDAMTCDGQVQHATFHAARQRVVMAIEDPLMAHACFSGIYEPYRLINEMRAQAAAATHMDESGQ